MCGQTTIMYQTTLMFSFNIIIALIYSNCHLMKKSLALISSYSWSQYLCPGFDAKHVSILTFSFWIREQDSLILFILQIQLMQYNSYTEDWQIRILKASWGVKPDYNQRLCNEKQKINSYALVYAITLHMKCVISNHPLVPVAFLASS